MQVSIARIGQPHDVALSEKIDRLINTHQKDIEGLLTLRSHFDSKTPLGTELDLHSIRTDSANDVGFIFGRRVDEGKVEIGAWTEHRVRCFGIGSEAIRIYLSSRLHKAQSVGGFMLNATDLVMPASRLYQSVDRPSMLPYPYNEIVVGFDISKGVPAGLLESGAAVLLREGELLERDIQPVLAALRARYALNLPDDWGLQKTVVDGRQIEFYGAPPDDKIAES